MDPYFFSSETMPRQKILQRETKKRRKWSEEGMRRAVMDVISKKSGYKKATREHQVPKTTLMRHCAANAEIADGQSVKISTLGRKPVLGDKIEQQLLEYSLAMEERFFGLTRRDLMRTAYQLAVKHHVAHPFRNKEGGRGWFDLFYNHHKDKVVD